MHTSYCGPRSLPTEAALPDKKLLTETKKAFYIAAVRQMQNAWLINEYTYFK